MGTTLCFKLVRDETGTVKRGLLPVLPFKLPIFRADPKHEVNFVLALVPAFNLAHVYVHPDEQFES